MTRFEKLTEEEKKLDAYNYALMHAQAFLCNPITATMPALELYRKELKAAIEWLAKQLDLEGLSLYPDP